MVMNAAHAVAALRREETLAVRILRNLRARHCMRIDELCLRLGEPEDRVRAELEKLRLHGTIERMRPIGYAGADLDVYAVPKPVCPQYVESEAALIEI